MAEALNLPLLPTTDNRINEINNSRRRKLVVDDVLHLPFPEDLKSNWQSGSQYLPNATLEVIKEYATNKSAMKAFREGKNLQYSGHVKDVAFNNIVDSIRYCYVRATVVPQTRINENPYFVWVCFYGSEYVFTPECSCIAGFSSSCKHVFSL
ncbi:uncharacterized protein LOC136095112 [Hydra vulgaris]|uniref:uncharacterized protein LOC136095112 n=1 Tax=Hydra vulgaris TaxID=6087 RepID=UPI0032EA52FD